MTSESAWHALCLKLATEKDPIRMAVFLRMLNDMLATYVEEMAAEKNPGLEQNGRSKYIH